MSEERIITIAAIVIAVILFYRANAFVRKRYPSGLMYVRLSGLIYLSVTVVLMFIARLRPSLSLTNLVLIEAIALAMHLAVLILMIFIMHKYKSIHAQTLETHQFKNKTDDSMTSSRDNESDVKAE